MHCFLTGRNATVTERATVSGARYVTVAFLPGTHFKLLYMLTGMTIPSFIQFSFDFYITIRANAMAELNFGMVFNVAFDLLPVILVVTDLPAI